MRVRVRERERDAGFIVQEERRKEGDRNLSRTLASLGLTVNFSAQTYIHYFLFLVEFKF